MSKYYPPSFMKKQFNCVHCGVYAKQNWYQVGSSGSTLEYKLCVCEHCIKNPYGKMKQKLF